MPRYIVERTFPGSEFRPCRKAQRDAGRLPVDRITQVRVLDPYFNG